MLIMSISQAHDLEEITGKIKYLEPNYLPEVISFNMHGGSACCPAKNAIAYGTSSSESNLAVYSTLFDCICT